MNESKSKHDVEGIQVLRAVAALLVVMHHARHSVPGSEGWPDFGAAGVDIFFVISGFVMALTTHGSAPFSSATERIAASSSFMRKRLARIVPLYWLALLWTSRREISHGQVDSNLLKDFAFIPHPNNIYPDMLWPSVIQGWTLNYEMFFYAAFALSLLFGRWRTHAIIGFMLALISLGPWLAPEELNVRGSGTIDSMRIFYTNDVLLEFIYGVVLYRLVARKSAPNCPRFVFFCIAGAGFLLLAFGAKCLSILGWEEPLRSIAQGLPAAIIVWSSIYAFSNLRVRVLEILGEASYAIYLFHWASFGLLKPLAAALGPFGEQFNLVTILMILHIVIAALCGIVIHVFIEKPLLKLSQRLFGIAQAK